MKIKTFTRQHHRPSNLHFRYSYWYVVLFIALGATLTDGCRLPEINPPTAVEPPKTSLVWPAPPLQPRIRFVRAIARPADLGIQPSFFGRLFDIIVGKGESWLIRPTGVAASGQTILIADAGAQAFWILNPQAGKYQKIQKPDAENLVSPVAVVPGRGNRFYLADSYLNRIFAWDSDGRLLFTVSDPGFHRPAGLAYDATTDHLYVADSALHRIFIFTGEGKPLGAIGQRGSGDGEFNFPTHLAVDGYGDLYVTDSLNFRLQIFDRDGKFVSAFGRHGDSSGDFASPKGVAVDDEGHIYVIDALFDAVQIFDRQGRYLLTFGERGIGPGQFWLPNGIFIDRQERIYVADSYNQRIQIFEYLKGES